MKKALLRELRAMVALLAFMSSWTMLLTYLGVLVGSQAIIWIIGLLPVPVAVQWLLALAAVVLFVHQVMTWGVKKATAPKVPTHTVIIGPTRTVIIGPWTPPEVQPGDQLVEAEIRHPGTPPERIVVVIKGNGDIRGFDRPIPMGEPGSHLFIPGHSDESE